MRQEVIDLNRPQLEGEDVLTGSLGEGEVKPRDGGVEELLGGKEGKRGNTEREEVAHKPLFSDHSNNQHCNPPCLSCYLIWR